MIFDDDHDELRRIERVRYEDSSLSWMAVTVLCDDEGNTKCNPARLEYHLNNQQSGIDDMIREAAEKTENEDNKPPVDIGAWDLHVRSKIESLNKQQWMLRRMQCKLGGFSPAVARKLMVAITEGSTNYAAEMWNMAKTQWPGGSLDTAVAQMHRQILGCHCKTSTCAMRAELAVTSQQRQRVKSSLRFMHRITSMEPHRLTLLRYKALKSSIV